MSQPIIFLDIDGTLNGEKRHPNRYCGIDPACVYRLNRIVEETGAALVISSAWRYMIERETMTLKGFKFLLMTYGLASGVELLGCTPRDEFVTGRGPQIDHWLGMSGRADSPYVVLDNGSDEPPRPPETMTLSASLWSHHDRHWVKTASHLGLTDFDVVWAVAILKGGPAT